jgi:hypothetical protein
MDRRTFVDLTVATTANSLLSRIAFAQTAPKAKNVVPTTAGVIAMNAPTYDKSISALLVVDPYNDFISEGGKIWPRIKAVAEANDCVSNMLKVLNAAREVKLRVFYAMHHRYRAGRLRNVDLHCADSTSHVAAQELRIRHMGWRVPCRIRAGAG